jgi:hypothetical protein
VDALVLSPLVKASSDKTEKGSGNLMWLVRTNAVVPVVSLRFSPLKHEIQVDNI